MSQKNKYYEIFGLTENATKNDIRKAYRKLAMQFHPDKNPDPKANELFIQLTEAYEFLLEDKPYQHVKTKKEKTFEERKKEAAFRYQKHQEREKKEQDIYFQKLTSGWKWKIFNLFSILSLIVSIVLFIEPFLPSIFENHQVIAKSETYNGIIRDQVVCIKTNKDLNIFVKNPFNSIFSYYPEIVVEKSLILHNPIKIWLQTIHYHKSFDIDFSVINLYPILPVLFSIPFFVYRFKRKSFWFTVSLLTSQIIILPFLIWILITQDRWIHLLTFGLI